MSLTHFTIGSRHNKVAIADYLDRLEARQAYRQARTTFPSEKMAPSVWSTTKAQKHSLFALELLYDVVSYETWPDPVGVFVADRAIEFHAPIGLVLANGERVFVDYLRREDEANEVQRELSQAFALALKEHDVRLWMQSEDAVFNDPNLLAAKEIMRSVRHPVDDAMVVDIMRLLGDRGGRAALADIRDAHKCGHEAWATTCVLAMKRRVRLRLSASGAASSLVELPEMQH